MDLIAYVRTSTANGGHQDSLDAQADACRAWAKDHGHRVVDVLSDPGVSGKVGPDQRPGLKAALLALEEGEAEGIVVHRLDRLARQLHVQEVVLARVWEVGSHAYEAISGEVLRDDPDDPMRTFARQVMGAAAQLERGMITVRLRGGRRRKKERDPAGYLGGATVPFGYRVDGAGRLARVVPDPEAQPLICRVLDLRKTMTHKQTAEALNAEGIPSPRGGRWHVATVQRVEKHHAAT